jgi:hypothetical protein
MCVKGRVFTVETTTTTTKISTGREINLAFCVFVSNFYLELVLFVAMKGRSASSFGILCVRQQFLSGARTFCREESTECELSLDKLCEF